MDFSNNNLGYFPQMPVCNKHILLEVNSDFSLPDYQSEIKRLLSTRVCIIPAGEYIGNGDAELTGELIYKILYLGADGKIYSAALSDKYSAKLPLEFNSHSVNTDDVVLFTSLQNENVNTRVLGPRKLNVKAKLSCKALALSPALYSPSMSGIHNDSCIENLVFETESLFSKKCIGEPQVLTDYIPLDSQIDNVRIIDSASAMVINECAASEDKVNVKGEALVKIAYCNDAESDHPLSYLRKLPFSSQIYCDGITSDFECSARGFIIEEQINIDESGISVELSVSVSVFAQKNESVPYIADSYSTEKAVECTYSELKTMNALRASNSTLTQNEVFYLGDLKISPDAKLIDVCGRAKVNELTKENGRLSLKGECVYQVIYYLDGEYSSRDISAPFKYELDSRVDTPDTDSCNWFAEVELYSARARHDGERLFVDSELGFAFLIQAQGNIKILNDMVFGEKLVKASGELIICYPDKNSTVWEIAKKYGESGKKIRSRNAISDAEDTVKRKFLII